ncbi:VUT family protein [Dongia soli]|uniref:VUT family protein n=1 Tax=Dongia soli TaxID=600628 RepID=UPI003611E2E5
MLTEYYGRAPARRGFWLGFAVMLLMTCMMMLAIGYRPMTAAEAAKRWPGHCPITTTSWPCSCQRRPCWQPA